jgi:hypothetical protein
MTSTTDRRLVVSAVLAVLALAGTATAGEPTARLARPRSGRVAVVRPYQLVHRTAALADVVAERKAEIAAEIEGKLGSGHGAAFHELVIDLPMGASVEVVRRGNYDPSAGVDVNPIIRLRGFGGDVEAVHLGSVSVHHIKGADRAANLARYEELLRTDTMAIEVDGRRVVDRSRSGKVGEHAIVLPAGSRAIEYIRQLANGGERDASGYKMGRLIELLWD